MPPHPTTAGPPPPRLVILGCGYVGTALARSALAAGWTVSALTRNPTRAAELRALGVHPVAESDLVADSWHSALDPADAAIVNTVAPASREPAGYIHSFVDGARSLTRWLENSVRTGHPPARTVLFTSATSVYPQTDGSWVDESTPIDPATLGPTGAALHEGENLILRLPPLLARRTWVLRLGGLYGPNRHHLLDALRSGQRIFPGRGDFWVNLIHRDDVVAAILLCLSAPGSVSGGLLNVVDNYPVLKQDFLAGLARIHGLDPATLRFDPSAPSPRARRRENAEGNVPSRRIANNRLVSLGLRLRYPSFEIGFSQGLTAP